MERLLHLVNVLSSSATSIPSSSYYRLKSISLPLSPVRKSFLETILHDSSVQGQTIAANYQFENSKQSIMLRRVFLFVAFFILNTILAEDIHYLSTGEDPEVFVKNKIDSHDVSFATKITTPRRVSRKLVSPLTTPTGALGLLLYFEENTCNL